MTFLTLNLPLLGREEFMEISHKYGKSLEKESLWGLDLVKYHIRK